MLEWLLVLTEGQSQVTGRVSLTGEHDHRMLSCQWNIFLYLCVLSLCTPGPDWVVRARHFVWSTERERERERERQLHRCCPQRWPDWWRHSDRDNWSHTLSLSRPLSSYIYNWKKQNKIISIFNNIYNHNRHLFFICKVALTTLCASGKVGIKINCWAKVCISPPATILSSLSWFSLLGFPPPARILVLLPRSLTTHSMLANFIFIIYDKIQEKEICSDEWALNLKLMLIILFTATRLIEGTHSVSFLSIWWFGMLVKLLWQGVVFLWCDVCEVMMSQVITADRLSSSMICDKSSPPD